MGVLDTYRGYDFRGKVTKIDAENLYIAPESHQVVAALSRHDWAMVVPQEVEPQVGIHYVMAVDFNLKEKKLVSRSRRMTSEEVVAAAAGIAAATKRHRAR